MRARSEPLSPGQARALAVIVRWQRERGYAPTLRELADDLGVRSTNGMFEVLQALERKGAIRRAQRKARAIVVLNTAATD